MWYYSTTSILATKFPIPWRICACTRCTHDFVQTVFDLQSSGPPNRKISDFGNSSFQGLMSFSRRCFGIKCCNLRSPTTVITFCLRYRSVNLAFFHGLFRNPNDSISFSFNQSKEHHSAPLPYSLPRRAFGHAGSTYSWNPANCLIVDRELTTAFAGNMCMYKHVLYM